MNRARASSKKRDKTFLSFQIAFSLVQYLFCCCKPLIVSHSSDNIGFDYFGVDILIFTGVLEPTPRRYQRTAKFMAISVSIHIDIIEC